MHRLTTPMAGGCILACGLTSEVKNVSWNAYLMNYMRNWVALTSPYRVLCCSSAIILLCPSILICSNARFCMLFLSSLLRSFSICTRLHSSLCSSVIFSSSSEYRFSPPESDKSSTSRYWKFGMILEWMLQEKIEFLTLAIVIVFRKWTNDW